jgi:hypothetical protein
MLKRIIKNLLALGVGLFIALVLVEVVLHFYNPFSHRVKGNEIVLPSKQVYKFSNVNIRGLDKEIKHTKNSLGFRGPELPTSAATKRIFCVGGSTTECFYMNDGDDWPAVFSSELAKLRPKQSFWVNNAGLDGHSTRGHIVLLRDHISKLKPDYLVFLVGCNDLAAGDFNYMEQNNLVKNMRFLQKFELFNLYLQFKLSTAAAARGLGHQQVDLGKWPTADTLGWKSAVVSEKVVTGYKLRLQALAQLAKLAGAKPVFVTQPCLFANATDSSSGRYLGNFLYREQSGLHHLQRLEMLNQTLRTFCKNAGYLCIDAANMLPASAANFYDFFHYTRAGSSAMGRIVANGFATLLN